MGAHSFLKIGVTGGIGSGKSTVCTGLVQHGLALVDADRTSRTLTQVGGDAIPLIAATFGAEFIAANGAMDREKMRQLVFADPTARSRLEAILHPLVRQNFQQEIDTAQAQGFPAVVCEIPLLVEGKIWLSQMDCVLVVDCTPELQVQRVVDRSGLSQATVRTIMASQASRAQRLACADAVILNEGTDVQALYQQLDQWIRALGLINA